MFSAASVASSACDTSERTEKAKVKVTCKCAVLGDSQTGKTALIQRYVEGTFDGEYVETLGANFLEKVISVRNNDVTFSIWDTSGLSEFQDMLPLVCNEALALIFVFDLLRPESLNGVKNWFRKARLHNRSAPAFLVGAKFDLFCELPQEDRDHILRQARKFAKAMKSPLVFTSSEKGINTVKLFKLIFSIVFDVPTTLAPIESPGPVLEF